MFEKLNKSQKTAVRNLMIEEIKKKGKSASTKDSTEKLLNKFFKDSDFSYFDECLDSLEYYGLNYEQIEQDMQTVNSNTVSAIINSDIYELEQAIKDKADEIDRSFGLAKAQARHEKHKNRDKNKLRRIKKAAERKAKNERKNESKLSIPRSRKPPRLTKRERKEALKMYNEIVLDEMN